MSLRTDLKLLIIVLRQEKSTPSGIKKNKKRKVSSSLNTQIIGGGFYRDLMGNDSTPLMNYNSWCIILSKQGSGNGP